MLRNTLYILGIMMAFSFYSCQASDSLTRLEVYNFSMGDTFDYRHHGHSDDRSTDAITNYVSFDTLMRKVVTGIYWSTDSSIKYIVRQRLFSAPVNYDTLVLNNLLGYEILVDSALWQASSISDSCMNYFGQQTNCINFRSPPFGWNSTTFARDLGQVIALRWGGVTDYEFFDTLELIYYSGGLGIFGTPYTSFSTGISTLSSFSGIKVFPTVNNGAFTIKISDETSLPVNFEVFNILGEEIMRVPLNGMKNEINIPGSPGLYIWKATDQQNQFITGRVIVE